MSQTAGSNLLPDNGAQTHPFFKLGKKPAMARPQSLLFEDFASMADLKMATPIVSNFWQKRAPFPLGTWGNNQYGDCTRASQAVAAMRNERLEVRQTPTIPPEEVVRVYVDMSNRLYGGGDNGAYEEDALAEWRKPDLTFRDTHGRPHTIDAFTRLNPKSADQIKAAIFLAGGSHGIKVCFNLPTAWQALVDQKVDLTAGDNTLTGAWTPGSWGGHSMYADDYDEFGVWVQHTWNLPRQRVTWAAVYAYCDEAHSYVDSLDQWRNRPQPRAAYFNIRKLVDAVNQVSSQKVKAK